MNMILYAAYTDQSAIMFSYLFPYETIYIVPVFQWYGHFTCLRTKHDMIICCYFTHKAKLLIFLELCYFVSTIRPSGAIFHWRPSHTPDCHPGFIHNGLASGALGPIMHPSSHLGLYFALIAPGYPTVDHVCLLVCGSARGAIIMLKPRMKSGVNVNYNLYSPGGAAYGKMMMQTGKIVLTL